VCVCVCARARVQFCRACETGGSGDIASSFTGGFGGGVASGVGGGGTVGVGGGVAGSDSSLEQMKRAMLAAAAARRIF
jgi:hypothetical protein